MASFWAACGGPVNWASSSESPAAGLLPGAVKVDQSPHRGGSAVLGVEAGIFPQTTSWSLPFPLLLCCWRSAWGPPWPHDSLLWKPKVRLRKEIAWTHKAWEFGGRGCVPNWQVREATRCTCTRHGESCGPRGLEGGHGWFLFQLCHVLAVWTWYPQASVSTSAKWVNWSSLSR